MHGEMGIVILLKRLADHIGQLIHVIESLSYFIKPRIQDLIVLSLELNLLLRGVFYFFDVYKFK